MIISLFTFQARVAGIGPWGGNGRVFHGIIVKPHSHVKNDNFLLNCHIQLSLYIYRTAMSCSTLQAHR